MCCGVRATPGCSFAAASSCRPGNGVGLEWLWSDVFLLCTSFLTGQVVGSAPFASTCLQLLSFHELYCLDLPWLDAACTIETNMTDSRVTDLQDRRTLHVPLCDPKIVGYSSGGSLQRLSCTHGLLIP